MRIALNRQYLPGFKSGYHGLDVPVVAAKVGSKTQGLSVPTACYSEFAKIAPSGTTLTFRTR